MKKRFCLALLFICSLNLSAQWYVNTLAGGGVGDGGPPAMARFGNVFQTATDTAGNIYIADKTNHRIRKVTPAGVISTVAGNGVCGSSGDGGPATAATLNFPSGVAVDRHGNMYIAEYGSHHVRKVDPSGIITKIAGGNTPGPYGDNGPANLAGLHYPYGLTVDRLGDLYIADAGNNKIRKIHNDTITTVAGNGAGFYNGDGNWATSSDINYPTGVAFDTAGNMFIADQANNRIRVVNRLGIMNTLAGNGTQGFTGDGGPATSAELNYPCGVAADRAGNVYIADQNNHRIRKVDLSGTIQTFAGNGTRGYTGDGGAATLAEIGVPNCVAVDSLGSVLIGDDVSTVRKVAPSGIISTVAGNGVGGCWGDGNAAPLSELTAPMSTAVDNSGNIYIADWQNQRIRMVNSTGIIQTIAGTGTAGYSGDGGPAVAAELNDPYGVAVDGLGNVFIAEWSNHRIRKIDPSGIISTYAGTGTAGFSGDGGPATAAQLNHPETVAADSIGNVYLSDYNARIRKISTSGIITTIAGTGVSGFSGDGGPAISAKIGGPVQIAVDNHGNLFLVEMSQNRVRHINSLGVITTFAGTGVYGTGGLGGPAVSAQLAFPHGVALDKLGNVFLADGNCYVKIINSNGIINQIAGYGGGCYGGDGGPASLAQFWGVMGLSVDGADNLYIADQNNNRVRMLYLCDTCKMVWPGDANNDCVADNNDILSIGIGYGRTGPGRINASSFWTGQPCYQWADTLTNGTNYKYIDCNGDGIINGMDTNTVLQNYGLHHVRGMISQPVYNSSLPDLVIHHNGSDTLGSNVNSSFDLSLGSATLQVNNVYGLAFTIHYDSALILPSSLNLKTSGSWMGNNGSSLISLSHTPSHSSTTECAITRITQTDTSGYGSIATVYFQSRGGLTGTGTYKKNVFYISDMTVISYNQSILNVNPVSDSVYVFDPPFPLVVKNIVSSETSISIDPNPFHESTTIHVKPAGKTYHYVLCDMTGSVLREFSSSDDHIILDREGLGRGMYLLKVYDSRELIGERKCIIN